MTAVEQTDPQALDLDAIEARATAVDAALAEVDRRDSADENYAVSMVPSLVSNAVDESQADVPDLVAELRRARTALDALGTERNAWARQMADLRDDLDAARQEAAEERARRAAAETERDVLTANVHEIAAEASADIPQDVGNATAHLIAQRLREALARAETGQ
ncbi:hypothetical protein DNL40_02530 [Xylanimonas oleitrophica]|uniref:Uncharacterized protein n=1 Tax=Xylanimonas oleitrophica TaxID=2607479 RepID=A0A2W5X2W4_9MICO|nr:hypothetical protein [Xylanimonas oleitrophica]PZR55266.1 hypothetical protein DNL40_02530 [Xylanimonas oleitrophica]